MQDLKKIPYKYFITITSGISTKGQKKENKTDISPFLTQKWRFSEFINS